jgi:hypothetical protein
MAGVVHQDADGTKLFLSCGHHVRTLCIVGKVRRRIRSLPTVRSDFVRSRGEFPFGARGKKYRGSFLREQARDGAADAAARAGDQSDLILKQHGTTRIEGNHAVGKFGAKMFFVLEAL